MRQHIHCALLAMALVCGPTTWAASDFDGSKRLICAPVEAMDCTAGMKCSSGQPAEIGAPAFMRIDFAEKVVIGPDRTSQIKAMDDADGQLLLQGMELGFGWTLAIHQATGSMSASLVNRDGVFVLLGSCTVL